MIIREEREIVKKYLLMKEGDNSILKPIKDFARPTTKEILNKRRERNATEDHFQFFTSFQDAQWFFEQMRKLINQVFKFELPNTDDKIMDRNILLKDISISEKFDENSRNYFNKFFSAAHDINTVKGIVRLTIQPSKQPVTIQPSKQPVQAEPEYNEEDKLPEYNEEDKLPDRITNWNIEDIKKWLSTNKITSNAFIYNNFPIVTALAWMADKPTNMKKFNEMIKLFIEAGASIKNVSPAGSLPIDLAKKNKNIELENYLSSIDK